MTTTAELLASTALIACIIRHADAKPMDALPPININGQHFKLAFNTELSLPQAVIDVAREAGVNIELLTFEDLASESPALDDGNGDAVAAVGVGGQPDGSGSSSAEQAAEGEAGAEATTGNQQADPALLTPAGDEPAPFDPEAIIVGNVTDVAHRLAGLTAEQLAAVRAAEVDREDSRVGVLKAIDKAAAALTA